jgi:hypothetical protein
MSLGVPEPRLRDRVATKAPYAVDTGGLSGGQESGASPLARNGQYDGYDPTTRFASNGVTMRPARLIQRVAARGSTMQNEGLGG